MKKVLILLFFFCTSILNAQEIQLKTGVDKSTIHIGDYIKYYIEIEYNKNLKLILPAPGANLGKFDIKDYNVVSMKSDNKNKIKKRIEYTITTYFLGEFQIPAVDIKYLTPDKQEKSIKSDSVLIKVIPIERKPTDKDDIRDIKSPYEMKSYFFVYFLVALFIIGIAVALYFLYFKDRFKKDINQEKIDNIPAIPEDEDALNKIEELLAKNYIEQGLIKEFYFELSEIIREYIGRRYKIVTLERTSGEILRDLNKFLDKKNIKAIEKFFTDTDLVKFAKYKPTKTELKNIVPFARDIIESTRIKRVVNNEVS